MHRIRFVLISGLSMRIWMCNVIILAVCLEAINVVLMFESTVGYSVLGLMLASMKSDLMLGCIETEVRCVKSERFDRCTRLCEVLSS